MADQPLFTPKELSFLRELIDRNVHFLIIGLSSAILQGAPVSTQDIDLWFEDLSDPQIANCLQKHGGIYVPPNMIYQTPPMIAGEGFELLDLVLTAHGLDSFEEEYKHALEIEIEGLRLRILPLERIIKSKEAAGRAKDKMALSSLYTLLKTKNS